MERRKAQKKAAATKVAAAAAAGGKSQGGKGKHKSKKGSDKPCEHCHKPGHTAQRKSADSIQKIPLTGRTSRPKSMAVVPLCPMAGRLRRLVWELRPLGLGLGLQFRQMSSPRRSRSSSPSGSVVPHGLPISGRTHFSSLRAQRGLWILGPVNAASWAYKCR